MESHGEPLKIHISPQCKEKLDKLGGYLTEERGIVSMKGKGDIVTYWLIGKRCTELLSSCHKSFLLHRNNWRRHWETKCWSKRFAASAFLSTSQEPKVHQRFQTTFNLLHHKLWCFWQSKHVVWKPTAIECCSKIRSWRNAQFARFTHGSLSWFIAIHYTTPAFGSHATLHKQQRIWDERCMRRLS